MADLKKTVEIIFGADDKVSAVIKNMSKSFDKIGGSVEGAAAPLAKVTDSVLGLSAALTTMAVGGLAVAYNASLKFENSVIDLNKVLGEGENIDTAIAKAKDLASTFGESSGSILESMAGFKQAGFDMEESMLLAEKALQLVVVGDIDAANATEMLIASLKGFGTEAKDSSRIVEILNAVSNTFATDVDQLGTAMSKLSPITNQLGFSMEETAALATPIIEVFRSGDEAAVALKTGLLKLTGESSKVQTALEEMGVEQKDLNGEMRSGKDIFFDVAKAFEGMTDSQRALATQQLVGLEQAGRMSVVFSSLSKIQSIVTVATDDTTSAYAELQARLESSEVLIKRLGVGFTGLAQSIGDQFKASANSAIGGMADLVAAITSGVGSGAFDPLFDLITSAGDKIGELLSTMAQNLPDALSGIDLSGIVEAFGGVGDTFGDFFGDIDLTTVEGLQKAIQGVIDTGELLINVTNGIVAAFQPYFDAFREAVSRGTELEGSAQKMIGEVLGVAKAITDLSVGVGLAMTAIDKSATKLGSIFDFVIGGIQVLYGGFLVAVDSVVGKMVGALQVTVGSFAKFISKLADLLGMEDAANNARIFAESFDNLRNGIESTKLDNLKKMSDGFDIAAGNIDKTAKATGRVAKETELALIPIKEVTKSLDILSLPKELSIDIEKATQTMSVWRQGLEGGAGGWVEIPIDIVPEVAPAAVKKVEKTIEELKFESEDGAGVEIPIDIVPEVAPAAVKKVKKTIGELKFESEGGAGVEIPIGIVPEVAPAAVKKVKKTIEELKFESETLQSAFEWKAKMDIAEVNANATKVKALADSISESFKSTGDVMSGLFDQLGGVDALDTTLQWKLEAAIAEEQKIRREQHDMQMKLAQAELDYTKLKNERLAAGDALIEIKADGLEPELESFMWKILEKIQVRANEEEAEFLLGI